jgi:hypothetical protein
MTRTENDDDDDAPRAGRSLAVRRCFADVRLARPPFVAAAADAATTT